MRFESYRFHLLACSLGQAGHLPVFDCISVSTRTMVLSHGMIMKSKTTQLILEYSVVHGPCLINAIMLFVLAMTLLMEYSSLLTEL